MGRPLQPPTCCLWATAGLSPAFSYLTSQKCGFCEAQVQLGKPVWQVAFQSDCGHQLQTGSQRERGYPLLQQSGRQSCEDTTEPRLGASCSWSCQPHLRSLILAECCLHLKESVQRKNYFFLLSFFSLPSGKLLLFACGHQVLSLDQALKIFWRVVCGCLSHPRADSWPAGL